MNVKSKFLETHAILYKVLLLCSSVPGMSRGQPLKETFRTQIFRKKNLLFFFPPQTHTIYFKESAYMIVESGKSEVYVASWKLGQKLLLRF